MSELRRLQRLEHLAARFEHKVGGIENWAQGKDEQLSRNDDLESANLAEVLVSQSSSYHVHHLLYCCASVTALINYLN